MIPGVVASSRRVATGYIARDLWLRTLTNDWGDANIGGTWAYWGTPTGLTVNNGTASMTMGSAVMKMATLPVPRSAVLMKTWASWNAAYGDATQHFTVAGRVIGDTPIYYQARVRVEAANLIRLRIQRDETEIVGSWTHPTAYTAGRKIHLVLEVSGTSPTLVRCKLWLDGDAEPAGWTLSGTDSTASHQVAGVVGLYANLGASANTRTITWGPLEVTAP